MQKPMSRWLGPSFISKSMVTTQLISQNIKWKLTLKCMKAMVLFQLNYLKFKSGIMCQCVSASWKFWAPPEATTRTPLLTPPQVWTTQVLGSAAACFSKKGWVTREMGASWNLIDCFKWYHLRQRLFSLLNYKADRTEPYYLGGK